MCSDDKRSGPTKLRRKAAMAGRVETSVIRIRWRGVPLPESKIFIHCGEAEHVLLYLRRLDIVRVSFHWNS